MHRCQKAKPLPHAQLQAPAEKKVPAQLRAPLWSQRAKAVARVDKILLRAEHKPSSNRTQVFSMANRQ